MPSRWISLAIVACWLAAMGWLFWQDLWPSWRPGEPPPFHIDLVEEVQKANKLRNGWTVLRQKSGEPKPHEIFRAFTTVEYVPDDDTFRLRAEFTTKKGKDPNAHPFEVAGFRVDSMTSEYRVDRAGELRALRAEIRVTPREQLGKVMALMGREGGESPRLILWGEVRGDQLFAHCRGSLAPPAPGIDIDLPPAPVSHNGSVIMPLHPVNRIHGLRAGQSWRQPVIDPFRDAFAILPGASGGVSYVNARVLPEPQSLELGPNAQTRCLVIEYEEDGKNIGSTWVEEGSERVQRQEAVLEGDRWIMQRDFVNRRTLGP
jgi:hypothetical protein